MTNGKWKMIFKKFPHAIGFAGILNFPFSIFHFPFVIFHFPFFPTLTGND